MILINLGRSNLLSGLLYGKSGEIGIDGCARVPEATYQVSRPSEHGNCHTVKIFGAKVNKYS